MLKYIKQSEKWETLSRKPFSWEEREKLENLIHDDFSVKEISSFLKRNTSIIYRELKRVEGKYEAVKAAKQAKFQRKKRGKKRTVTLKKDIIISNLLKDKYSVYEIAKFKIKTFSISIQTIYNWIKNRWINFKYRDLPRWRFIKRNKFKNGKRHNRRSILTRSEKINSRSVFGHWELDLLVGGRTNNKGVLLVLYERITRFTIIRKIESKKAIVINESISKIINSYGVNNFKTITTDNGKEFLKLADLEGIFNMIIYYCRPYRPYEKGGVENVNILIRTWIPKGDNFSHFAKSKIQYIENRINNKHRRILNGQTAREIFLNHKL